MESEKNKITTRFTDIYRESTINYWNMLLIVNTIIISIFSGINILSDYKIISAVIVMFSIISSFLLIQNSKTIKNIYQIIGKKSIQENIPDSEANKDINNAYKRSKETNRKEKIVEFILLVEAVLILIVISGEILNRNIDNSRQIYKCSKTPIHQLKHFNKNF